MPPRKQPKASILSTLIDDASEDDLGMSLTGPPTPPDSEEPPVTKRNRGRKAVPNTTAKQAMSSSTSSARGTTGAKSRAPTTSKTAMAAAAKKRGRAALSDLTNLDMDGATDEASDVEPLRKRTKGKSQQLASSSRAHMEVLETILSVPSGSSALLNEGEEESVMDESLIKAAPPAPEPQRYQRSRHPPPTSSNQQQQSRSRSASRSREPLLLSASRNTRAGSASSIDRIPLSATKSTGDSATLRRKLGETTTKLEAMQIKYSALRDLAGADAQQSAFDRLKSATDAKTKTQDSLVNSLRKEVQGLRGTDDTLRARMAELQAEVDRLKSENAELSNIRSENRILQGKVAALSAANARARSEEPTVVAGNNAKGKAGVNGKNKVEEANNAAMVMKLKEDLYCDLTGLMIHSVKRLDGEDIFDCIQTGRNGTLRFNLSMENPANASGSNSFDEVQMTYTPLLDEKNDRHLLEILEDFLVEDICFPRNHAQGFYTKVRESMMRKVVIED